MTANSAQSTHFWCHNYPSWPYSALCCQMFWVVVVVLVSGLSRGYMLLTKSPSQPTVLFRFSTQVSITRPGQFVNTAMADVIKVWQDYLSEPPDSSASTDNELMASAVNNLMKTLGSLVSDDILLRTQVSCFIFCMFCKYFYVVGWITVTVFGS